MNDFVPSLKKSERLNADQEKDLAQEIRAAENRARAAMQGILVAEAIVGAKPTRAERTRAGSVDRMESAVFALWDASKEDPSLREPARAARQAWREAEDLRWRLAMSGRRIARGEARKLSGPFMDEADLVQEGYIGLLRAAKRYDPERGIRFSTYARWWVRAQMTRAIDHTGRPVRLPGCAVEQTRNLRKAIRRFETSGEEFTMHDLAEEVGLDTKRVEVLLSQGQTISLDAPVDDDSRPRSVEDFLADDDAINPDEEVIRVQEVSRLLSGFQQVLTERHRYVLSRRYGLEDDVFRTLSEVGSGMSLSRERVRQIEREALMRLKEFADIRERAA